MTARSRPGGWDALHVGKLDCRREPQWGMPELAGSCAVPRSLTCWTELEEPADCAHFFTDDYRFERVWNRPGSYAKKLRLADSVLGPDFSCWRDWPPAAQLWNVYRSRWLCAFWESLGLDVIPTVTWSDTRSWAWAWAGIPEGSVVAVSTVGMNSDESARRMFVDGFAEMCARLLPDVVLVYGEHDLPATLTDLVPIVRYRPTRLVDARQRIEAGALRPAQQRLVV